MSRYSSPSSFTSVPAYEANRMRSPFLTWKLPRLPSSSNRPEPSAMTLPSLGFSLAVSGRTMPPAVFSSASRRRTRILSPRGVEFVAMNDLLLASKGTEKRFVREKQQLEGHQIQRCNLLSINDLCAHQVGV